MPARTANRAPASLPERARTSWSGCRGSRVTGGGRTPAAPLPPPRAAPVRSRARGDGCRWRTDESSRSLRRTAARPWPRARRRWFRTWHRSPRERTAARRARAARDRAAPPSGSTPDWRRAARAAAGRDRARAPRTPLRTRAPARHGRHTSARKRRHHEDESPGRGRSRAGRDGAGRGRDLRPPRAAAPGRSAHPRRRRRVPAPRASRRRFRTGRDTPRRRDGRGTAPRRGARARRRDAARGCAAAQRPCIRWRRAPRRACASPVGPPPFAHPTHRARRTQRRGADQRLEYCGRLRALWRPYFLRSTSRESRVMKPAFLSAPRNSGPAWSSARVMPWRIATACADTPPPRTLTSVRYWPAVEVTSNGWCTIMREVSRPKYASSGRAFTTISPAPGWRRMRATEDFRLPVAQMTEARSGLIGFSPALVHRHRLLRLVRMVGTRVDLELGRQAPAEAVLRQHADDSVAHEADRMPGQHLARARPPHAARIGRVTDVLLLLELLARQPDLGRVDDDHEVARVEVRREPRVGLPAQHRRDPGSEAAEDLALGVGDVPAARGARRLGAEAPGGSREGHRRQAQGSDGTRGQPSLPGSRRKWRGRRDSNSRPPA